MAVRLFARAKDLAGSEQVRVELADDGTVGDLRRRLAAQHPALAELLKRSAIAVDDEFADESRRLRPGGLGEVSVALIPPVSGGQLGDL